MEQLVKILHEVHQPPKRLQPGELWRLRFCLQNVNTSLNHLHDVIRPGEKQHRILRIVSPEEIGIVDRSERQIDIMPFRIVGMSFDKCPRFLQVIRRKAGNDRIRVLIERSNLIRP
jgi:hypothetical protein